MGRASSPLAGCTVEVIRRECFPDLQSRYLDNPESGPCQKFLCGQKFKVTLSSFLGKEVPEGFCPKAWQAIRNHVEDVLGLSDKDRCGCALADNAVIACCPDGTRPVIFKIVPGEKL